MTRVFIFQDYHKHSYNPTVEQIVKVDINKEIAELEKDGWEIKSIQHHIITKYYEYYETWNKDIFTVVAEKEK